LRRSRLRDERATRLFWLARNLAGDPALADPDRLRAEIEALDHELARDPHRYRNGPIAALLIGL
jgi:hypothetical protein